MQHEDRSYSWDELVLTAKLSEACMVEVSCSHWKDYTKVRFDLWPLTLEQQSPCLHHLFLRAKTWATSIRLCLVRELDTNTSDNLYHVTWPLMYTGQARARAIARIIARLNTYKQLCHCKLFNCTNAVSIDNSTLVIGRLFRRLYVVTEKTQSARGWVSMLLFSKHLCFWTEFHLILIYTLWVCHDQRQQVGLSQGLGQQEWMCVYVCVCVCVCVYVFYYVWNK